MNDQIAVTTESPNASRPERWTELREGFSAMLPLWTGAIISGLVFGVAARGIGFSPIDIQLMSLIVFTAAGQFTAIAMRDAGSSTIAVLVTIIALHAQLPLFGFAISRQLRPSFGQKLPLAFFLTDAAYGIAASRQPLRIYVIIGAGISMYIGWNTGTAIGLVTGNLLSAENSERLLFVIPLTFLIVLMPQIRSTPGLVTALVSIITTIAVSAFAATGIAVLCAGLTGCLAGAWLQSRNSIRDRQNKPDELETRSE